MPLPDSLQADVLVIGGGLAGTWAALGAARTGASVVLADKGYCGTSGVTAAAGPGHWWVPPDPLARAQAIERRSAIGLGLADPRWMARVLDTTWHHLPTLAGHYAFGVDDAGQTQFRGLRGPEYLRAMRHLVLEAGVRILDHCPMLELLQGDDGLLAGARGWQRRHGRAIDIRAGAVALATGGCAFRSKVLGADTNTGDGYLMAAEAGAELSGMEFSAYYTVAPVFSSMTRSMAYVFARYFDSSGRELDFAPGPDTTPLIGRALMAGPVWCRLDRMPPDIRARLHRISPNLMLPFVRRGIDPFTDKFEVTLRGEGTVRGIGGLRIAGDDCRTTVPGLFAAGDTATRQLVAGATTGGGAQNSAWALSSGLWAGQGAALHAIERRRRGPVRASPAGRVGLRPSRQRVPTDFAALRAAIQGPMLDIDKNMFRDGATLQRSIASLDAHWFDLARHGESTGADAIGSREHAAMLATARWCLAAARDRRESRGMHQRTDAPLTDAALAHRMLVGGLDQVWTRAETEVPA